MFAPAGEVSVNPGGEPERDDTGLPPVDIEIPDDARELDRDVQAYYRERRAQRRHQRGRRLRGSLAKDGIVLPLLACCLILALITGTLLTVFTATSDQLVTGTAGTGKTSAPPSAAGSPPAAAPSRATSSPASPLPVTLAGPVPDATIAVNGTLPIQVRDLSRAALVLIPANCNCTATVSWLISSVSGAHALTYLVYTASTKPAVGRLYESLSRSSRAQARLALDPDTRLPLSVPATLQSGGLTAILLGPSKDATFATRLSPGDDPTTLIKALTH
jgi:hypothetical protein